MKKTKRLISIFSAVALLAGIAVQAMPPGVAHAVAPEFSGTRNLTLEGDVVGGSAPGDGTDGNASTVDGVKHLFAFTLKLNDNIGSISFQYCTTAEAVNNGVGCIEPAGLDLSGAALSNETGVTGFTTVTLAKDVDASDTTATNNEIILGRGSVGQVTGADTPVSYEISGISNPSTANQTFFVRIVAYSTTNAAAGSEVEGGTVAASTANPIVLQGNMPESLVFCTGQTISKNAGGVPDCTTATAGNIFFNQLFSPTSTSYATSQMAASTNAGSGYAITVNGPTLTSGTNTITAMSTASTGNLGVSEFGMNLVHDTATDSLVPALNPLSADITDPSDGALLNGTPTANYASDGVYKYADTDTVANSGYNDPSAPVGTNAQIYTATYMVNVPGSQPAGTYTTTLTYICTPTF